MTAATDGNAQVLLAAEIHTTDDVGDVGNLRNQPRPPIDHGVIDLARRLVPVVGRIDQLTAKGRCKSLDGARIGSTERLLFRSMLHDRFPDIRRFAPPLCQLGKVLSSVVELA